MSSYSPLPIDPIPDPAKRSNLSRRDFAVMFGASAVTLAVAGCAGGRDTQQAGGSAAGTGAGAGAGAALVGEAQTAESQASLTPESAMRLLREGNQRFVSGQPIGRDYARQVSATSSGQYPFAVVLGCIDSRVPVETVFDQGIGDIFTARVAGNVMNTDLLGSMEFACSIAGSKAIVVLGHTACGAVKGTIAEVRMDNLTGLVEKIEPAVAAVAGERDASNDEYVDRVAEANVVMVVNQIRDRSPVLAELERNGEIAITPAMYDVSSGAVRFL